MLAWALSRHCPACWYLPWTPRPLLSHTEGPVAPTRPPGKKPTGKRLPGVGQETRRAPGENGLLFLIYGPEQVVRSKQEAAPGLEIPEPLFLFNWKEGIS